MRVYYWGQIKFVRIEAPGHDGAATSLFGTHAALHDRLCGWARRSPFGQWGNAAASGARQCCEKRLAAKRPTAVHMLANLRQLI